MNLSKNEIITTTFLLLAYTGYFLYVYLKPAVINDSSLIELQGQLSAAPIYKQSNGDAEPYIYFQINTDTRSFKIENCALKLVNFEKIMALKTKDSLHFKIKRPEHLSLREKINSKLEVYALSTGGQNLLTTEAMNTCEKSIWKELLASTILVLLSLLSIFGERLFAKKVKPKSDLSAN